MRTWHVHAEDADGVRRTLVLGEAVVDWLLAEPAAVNDLQTVMTGTAHMFGPGLREPITWWVEPHVG